MNAFESYICMPLCMTTMCIVPTFVHVLFCYLHLLRREYSISVLHLQVEVIFGTVCNPSLCVKLRTPSQFKVLNALRWRTRLSFDLVLPLFSHDIKFPLFLLTLSKLTDVRVPDCRYFY